eukprot:1327623-Prymnesium_polylepis.1
MHQQYYMMHACPWRTVLHATAGGALPQLTQNKTGTTGFSVCSPESASHVAGPQPTAPRAGRRCFASGSGVRRPGAQSYPVRTSSTSAVVAHRSWLQAHTQTV